MKIKKWLIYILLPLVLAIPDRTVAEETMIKGIVISVDRERSQVIMKLPDVTNESPHKITITVSEGWIPWGVRPGRMARAWGRMDKQGATFSATAVRPGIGADRTGIRGRLRKNCLGTTQRPSSHSDHANQGVHGTHAMPGMNGSGIRHGMKSRPMMPGKHR